ncbi:MAG: regulator [Cryobacterium sp.]|nr:regulator [Cryobacterium sp.]
MALPPELGGRLFGDLKAHGHEAVFHASNGADLTVAIGPLGVDAAITSARVGYLSASLLAACDDAGVRLIAVVESSAERVAATNLGLAEIIQADAPWQEFHAALTATPWESPTRTASPEASGANGTVIAVWGPTGAPGRTSLAINVAAELAAQGNVVVLADADTHGGAVAPALGLLDEAPGFAAACRLAGAGGLNHTELERVGQRYRSGHGSFWVLTGIGRPSRWPELSAERVEATIGQCRSFADYTVIDTGFSLENDEEISSDLFVPRRNAATIASLRSADRVLAVGAADPVALSRFLRAHVDLLDTVEPERVSVVINRLRAGVVGSSPGSQVAHTLRRFGGIADVSLIPHDPAAFDAALLAGQTLREGAGRSPARAAITALVAEHILPPEPARAPGRRRMPFPRRARVPQPSS